MIAMAMKSYQNHAELLLKEYLLADPLIPYTSIVGGIFACKMVYDLTNLFSDVYFKSYSSLTKLQRIEWNNRAISTFHAVFIATMSLYFVFCSDLFSDQIHGDLVTFQSSALSTFALGLCNGREESAYNFLLAHQGQNFLVLDLIFHVSDIIEFVFLALSSSDRNDMIQGKLSISTREYWKAKFLEQSLFGNCSVSVGYFISDLGMIIWFYPSLGGMEYVIHHFFSMIAVAYSMLTGEGQLYTCMVLISETTTPGINLRWYLDIAGMKRSKAYLVNGVVIFFAWFVARILLFIYLFYHVSLHQDQVKQMHAFGQLIVLVVPVVLSVMNLMWFWKIFKGMKKTLAKQH
ncbi:hypothetical protein SADUNF_Sadunf02G0047600 [Salix dunnii]|uniref:TLC domain-containing protein n=1 Tax=Salix dunnii TaxID=1413687 RepID=A0A835N642_9ROSI|nr:hypothetical protein SADUNF_Sadunf02G0047600 [Salix dunnii]